jgi:predicted RNA polymerase sigma factor
LLARLGRHREAVLACDAALALTANAAERDVIEQRRRSAVAASLAG